MRHSDVNEAINKALEVASPESSTTQTGTTGVSTSARVDAPEKIDVAQNALPTNEVSHEGRNAEVVGVKPGAGCGVKSPAENTGDTHLIKNSITCEGGDGYRATPPFPSDERFADNISRFVDRELAAVSQ